MAKKKEGGAPVLDVSETSPDASALEALIANANQSEAPDPHSEVVLEETPAVDTTDVLSQLDANVYWPSPIMIQEWAAPDMVTPFDDPFFAYESCADLIESIMLQPNPARDMFVLAARLAARGYGHGRWQLGGKIQPDRLQPWLRETLNYLHGYMDPVTKKFYDHGDFKAVFNPKEGWKQDGQTWAVFSYPATVIVYEFSHRLGFHPGNRKVIELTHSPQARKSDVLICHPRLNCGMVIGSDVM